MASPGTLCKPTNVAAVSCQPLSPAFNQLGPDVISRNIKRVVLPKPRFEAIRPGAEHHPPCTGYCPDGAVSAHATGPENAGHRAFTLTGPGPASCGWDERAEAG